MVDGRILLDMARVRALRVWHRSPPWIRSRIDWRDIMQEAIVWLLEHPSYSVGAGLHYGVRSGLDKLRRQISSPPPQRRDVQGRYCAARGKRGPRNEVLSWEQSTFPYGRFDCDELGSLLHAPRGSGGAEIARPEQQVWSGDSESTFEHPYIYGLQWTTEGDGIP